MSLSWFMASFRPSPVWGASFTNSGDLGGTENQVNSEIRKSITSVTS